MEEQIKLCDCCKKNIANTPDYCGFDREAIDDETGWRICNCCDECRIKCEDDI